MYTRKFSQNLCSPYNLKNLPDKFLRVQLSTKSIPTESKLFKLGMFQQLKYKIKAFIKDRKVVKIVCDFSHFYPEKSFKMWLQQFECVFAHRIRRGQQMMHMYSKLWEERALRDFLRRLIKFSISRNSKEFMFGAIGLTAYNWEEKTIKDEEFDSHVGDIDYIEVLKNNTICEPCDGDAPVKQSAMCRCGPASPNKKKSFENWTTFIEKDDLIVWRRSYGEEGLFEYKVYGSYGDVSAEDFLNVQIDTDYRKEWDTTAVQLQIGEKNLESNSDILYWEMQWPRFFVNRDYVFNRRYKIDNSKNVLMIFNKTTEYQAFPKYPDKYRVEEYWSCMVIKPYTEMSKPGLEFSLTYFDNPGVNIPSTVTTWVAKSAMPDYLTRLRHASKSYKGYCITKGTSKACDVIKAEERRRREQEEKEKLDYCANERRDIERIVKEIKRKANENLNRIRNTEKTKVTASDTQPALVSSNESKTFWKYFHPLYYFTT